LLPLLPPGDFLQDNANSDNDGRRWSPSVKSDALIALSGKELPVATGTVKFFNTTKGFGFIQPSDGSKDVFVHISAVERAGMGSLREGQKISYDVVNERGKDAASNLRNA
jgi:CspA family cold shock protein